MKYEFTVDGKEVLEQKGNVEFLIALEDNVDPNQVRSALEKMSADVGYMRYFSEIGVLSCKTDKATYERTFQTQLELDQNKKDQAGYAPGGYRELRAATVPSELSDKVNSVSLNGNLILA